MVMMRMPVLPIPVLMIMCLAENHCTNNIYDQPNFHDHHGGGNPHHDASASFRREITLVEDVFVGPVGKTMGMHKSVISLCRS